MYKSSECEVDVNVDTINAIDYWSNGLKRIISSREASNKGQNKWYRCTLIASN